jgi:hypothetical protein
MKNLVGQITIGRISGSDNAQPIRIEISDKASGSIVLQASMTLEDFATAITGCGYMPCSLKLNDDPKGIIGKQIESKTELVPFKWSGAYDDKKGKVKAAAIAAKPFLVDGWSEFRADDFFNHHCWVRTDSGEFQRVVFWRYVAQAEKTPSDALSSS